MIKINLCRLALCTLVVMALPAMSHADTYTCKQIDVPGATWTQIWRLNDQGQVAAGSSLGGFIYDSNSGTWTALPEPPASSGYTQADMAPLDISDTGKVAGVAGVGGSEQGFVLESVTDPASYKFVPNYSGPDNPGSVFTHTEFRGINDSGLVNAMIFEPGTSTGIGLIYNPTSSTIGSPPGATFPPGYTPFIPTLSDGTKAASVITGGINQAGQFVGSSMGTLSSSREGFLYDPATLTSYTLTLPGAVNSLRGINDRDPNSAFNCISANCIRLVGFGRYRGTDNLFPFYVDFDPASGFQTPQIVDCSATVPASANAALFQGINNTNVATGAYTDTAGMLHGIIAYPNVAIPTQLVNGAFTFTVKVSPNVSVFLDPAIAVGYRYAIGRGDPRFGSVRLPIGIGDNSFSVFASGHAYPVAAGQLFDFRQNGFPAGATDFTVMGIESSANLSVSNTTAFVTEVTFVAGGQFTGKMTPLTLDMEIKDLVHVADEYGGKLEDDAERVAALQRAGQTSATCGALAKFIADASSASARLGPNATNLLTMEAVAIGDAAGCP